MPRESSSPINPTMVYRRLGRTNLRVSVIGFGTCQLRMVPEQQAINALKRSFSLGVNIVHTAPDYFGSEDLVAEAVKSSGRDVIVCSQGYGDRQTCDHIFETTCRKLGKERLELFGIACVDDRERAGENVWGAGGLVEFLQTKKREGRLTGSFCTTHGAPDYILRLIRSDAFDAILIAYNPLEYHLLSYNPDPPVKRESLRGNPAVFPQMTEKDIGLMLMKPLAGGLLCNGKAFFPNHPFPTKIAARDILRYLLTKHPQVATVIPGTNSEEEAEENALAGAAPLTTISGKEAEVESTVSAMKNRVCDRCGVCDSACSRHLPVSWLFRAAYIENTGSMPFETMDRLRYFALHPGVDEAQCRSCERVTCFCPNGIDVRSALMEIHEWMKDLGSREFSPAPADTKLEPAAYSARLVSADLEGRRAAHRGFLCRVVIDNIGSHGWHLGPGHPKVTLETSWAISLPFWKRILHPNPKLVGNSTCVSIRGDVPTGDRCYFVFEIPVPHFRGRFHLRFSLSFLTDTNLNIRVNLGEFWNEANSSLIGKIALLRALESSRSVFKIKPQRLEGSNTRRSHE